MGQRHRPLSLCKGCEKMVRHGHVCTGNTEKKPVPVAVSARTPVENTGNQQTRGRRRRRKEGTS